MPLPTVEFAADMNIGRPERETQNRVIALFRDELHYRTLGDRVDRPGMDAELAALEQRRDKTRALKQGMMQELLTGKTRLV